MGLAEDIKEIVRHLALAAEEAGDVPLARAINTAISAVNASTARALSNERNMARAAVHSVMSGAMSAVGIAARSDEIPHSIKIELSAVADHVARIAEHNHLRPPRGDPHTETPPLGWRGKRNFSRSACTGKTIHIVMRPALPGGAWSVYYDGIFIGSCATLSDAASFAQRFELLVGDDHERHHDDLCREGEDGARQR